MMAQTPDGSAPRCPEQCGDGANLVRVEGNVRETTNPAVIADGIVCPLF